MSGSPDVRAMECETASSTVNLGASPMKLESLLRAYVDDIPESVVSIIAQRDELAGPSGRFEPLGAVEGMAPATVTRASHGARLKWRQFLDWRKDSCLLRALPPSSKEAKSPVKGRFGFDGLVGRDAFQRLRGLIPAQPDDKSRVWRVNP